MSGLPANQDELMARLDARAAVSPYLERLRRVHQEWLLAQAGRDANAVIDDLLAPIEDESFDALGQALRQRKGRAALYLGLCELENWLPVMEATRHLTRFADFAVETGLRALIAAEAARGKLPENATTRECGIFVLAMGKMGAFELNYSSDIDLIVFFDETRFEGADIFDVRKQFIRIIQRLVKLLSETTRDGYVFRTDLRLRPDPNVTPIVITTDQAESYYEALGRTWERAAYIKARVCAGDLAAGAGFLERLKPFIWRRHLDFAAIEDAHNMRLRIRAHKGLEGAIQFAGHHLKLGRGGIREIEFFTQTRQLIFGGRNEALRDPSTIGALRALAKAEIIESALAEELIADYQWLRHLEHITQIIDDQQTHLIPSSEEGIAAFLSLADADDAFESAFLARVSKIDALMERFFEGTRESEESDATALSPDMRALVEGWSQLPATRSSRAAGIFERIKPRILSSLLSSADPEAAFRAFDRFLRQQPAGVQLFSMFECNPSLLSLLTEICALAPSEARLLGSDARSLEAVLDAKFFAPLDGGDADMAAFRAHRDRELADAVDYEDVLNAVRRFVREAQFRVSVHLLRGLADAKIAGRAYSMIADLALETLHEAVSAEMTRRYGPPPGRGAAILAFGKLGSREMTRSSDLDLVVIYDAQGAEMSEGKKPLAVSAYFSRFTQNFIQALSVATAEGPLYEVDMRLRPSGRQGPVAVSLASFADYQLNEAWTWEHMALLRARPVAGDESLQADINSAIRAALAAPRDLAKTKADIMEMRDKIRENFPQSHALSLKHGAGRVMETELFLQGIALIGGFDAIHNSSYDLLEFAKGRLENDAYDEFASAFAIYAALSQLARLSFAGDPPETPPQSWLDLQAPLTNADDFNRLSELLMSKSSRISDEFDMFFQ